MSRSLLLVDFGGVLVHSADESVLHEWRQSLGSPRQSIVAVLFENHMSRSAMVGEIQTDRLFAELAVQLAIPTAQACDLWETFWRSQAANDQLIDYLRSLAPSVDIAVCSNFWPNYQEIMFRRYHLQRLTQRLFISSSLGCMKPSSRFFDVVKQRCQPQSRIALVDDLASNIAGAERSSIDGIHHSSTALTIQQIDRWLSSA